VLRLRVEERLKEEEGGTAQEAEGRERAQSMREEGRGGWCGRKESRDEGRTVRELARLEETRKTHLVAPRYCRY
jgi:hypothetical protein